MKARRAWFVAAAVAIAGLPALFIFLRPPRYLATSSDGRIRFILVKHQGGSSFSTAFGSRFEARVRDILFDIGVRNVHWVLNGVPHLDLQRLKLKVYLPEKDPTILPLPKQ